VTAEDLAFMNSKKLNDIMLQNNQAMSR